MIKLILIATLIQAYPCAANAISSAEATVEGLRLTSSKESITLSSNKEGYIAVAKLLADPFMSSRTEIEPRKELAQLVAELNTRVIRYRTTQTTNRLLQRIAADAADAGDRMSASQQRMDSLLRNNDFYEQVLTMYGLCTGNATAVLSGTKEILSSIEKKRQEQIEFVSAFNKSRAAQLMLPGVASEYAGPNSDRLQVLGIDFNESLAGNHNYDEIELTNNSGQDLSNCMVLVELHGRDGEVRQNVHWVPNWKASTKRYARYGIGSEFQGIVFGRRTVFGVQKLVVSIWSDQMTQLAREIKYVGTERDVDMATALMNLGFGVRFVRTPLFSDSPELKLVLDGVNSLPPHRMWLILSDSRSGQKQTWEFNHKDNWFRDVSRKFKLTTAPRDFRPTDLEILISIDQSAVVLRRKSSLAKK